MKTLRACLFAAALCALTTSYASAPDDDYPSRPIRMVTSAAGGGTDFVARVLAQGLSDAFEDQVIVDNRPSIFHGNYIPHATPDGYSLLMAGETIWIGPLLRKTPYEPLRDMTPVALVTTSPNVLVVHPNVPIKTVQELISTAKAKPGTLNYGSASPGSSSHLAAAMFESMAHVKLQRIAYSGSGPMLNAMLGGQGVHLSFASIGSVTPHVKGGRLWALAVTSPKTSTLYPGLPAIAEFLPGYEFAGSTSVMAPPKTPRRIVNVLNREIVRLASTPAFKDKMFNGGNDVSAGTPEQLRTHMKNEMVRIAKVIKDADIPVQK